jgi:hypothetical protein
MECAIKDGVYLRVFVEGRPVFPVILLNKNKK